MVVHHKLRVIQLAEAAASSDHDTIGPCRYNPAERPTAQQAAGHPYFEEQPLPAAEWQLQAFVAQLPSDAAAAPATVAAW